MEDTFMGLGDRALTHLNDQTEAEWIYFKGKIQCFICGWCPDKVFEKPDDAISEWNSHKCDIQEG